MKNVIIVFALLFVTNFTFAQMTAKSVAEMPAIEEEDRNMSKGTNTAFVIMMEGVSKNELEKEWKDFTKGLKAKAKQARKSKEWFSNNAKIPNLSDNTVDVYADIRYETKENSSITVWFDLGGDFVNSKTQSEATREANKILQKFVLKVYKHEAEDFLKLEKKTLSGLEKDLKKLEKDKKDYEKKIEEAKATIAKMEKNIEVNIENQKKKAESIEAQKQAVDAAGNKVKDFDKMN